MKMMSNVLTLMSIISIFLPLLVSRVQTSTHPGKTKVTAVTSSKTALRIWNGKPALEGEIPYMVSIKEYWQEDNLYHSLCGGTLIGETCVMTAAHCFCEVINKDNKTSIVKWAPSRNFYAVAGNLFNAVTGKIGGQWRRFKYYKPKVYKCRIPLFHDMAILRTAQPFKLDKTIGTVPFAIKDIDYGAKRCLTAGFGLTNPKLPESASDVLLKADLLLLSSQQCEKLDDAFVMRRFICTSSKETDPLSGDSGGPIVCKNTGDPREGKNGLLVGLVSGSYSNISVCTRVSKLAAFAQDKCGSCRVYSVAHIVWLSFIVLHITC